MRTYDQNWSEEPAKEHTWRTRIPEEEVQLLQKEEAKSILDLGCGDGTTLAHLSSLGFAMTGIDYSEVGIAKAREKGTARLIVGDIYTPLPFEEEEFDAVIAYQVINHNTIGKIRGLLKEIMRVLRKDGIFSVKVSDSATYTLLYFDGLYFDEYGSVFERIADRTYIPIAGHEKGVVHYEFNEEIIIKELEEAGFSILDKRHLETHIIINCRK